MKKLLAKIRRMLRDRRIRRLLTRAVSVTAAIVVFVTTYALVLPAITMELEAKCGIPAHQHTSDCYEEQLVCGLEESPGHHHGEECYTSSTVLVCESEEHVHEDACYDDNGELVCEKVEHVHSVDGGCYEEERVLTCEIPESDGHEHTADCYKKVLTCGLEVHTHSAACYESDSTAAETGEQAAVEVSSSMASTGAASVNNDDSDDNSFFENNETVQSEDASTALTIVDNAAAGVTADGHYVPELAPINFSTVLNDHTGIYYHMVADGDVIEDSTQIPATEWNRVDKNTELGKQDLLRVYLAYSIPAGSLNTTNQTARYRLPANLHLTDSQVKAINETVNGIAGQYVDMSTLEILDVDKYYAYLGVEAVEGTRTPSEDPNQYLADLTRRTGDGSEYISALVRVENVYDEQTGEYEGQDLVFTWTPYSIEKNQHEYDSTGQPIKAGTEIEGWLTLDFNLGLVDLIETVVDTFEREVETAGDQTVVDHSVESNDADPTVEDQSAEEDETGTAAATVETVEHREQTADIVFVAEDRDENNNKIHEISTTLTVVEETVVDVQIVEAQSEEAPGEGAAEDQGDADATDATAATTEEAAVEDQEQVSESTTGDTSEQQEENQEQYQSGTLTAEGDGYRITLDYTADARIPADAKLKVSEITAESDPEAYEACLEQARASINADDASEVGQTVDKKATRFFDIEIWKTVTGEGGQEKTVKIEPAAPVAVNIQLENTDATTTSSASGSDNKNTAANEQTSSDPTILHFAEEGVEKIESTTVEAGTSSTSATSDTTDDNGGNAGNPAEGVQATTEIQFQAESFSIYGVVYKKLSTTVLTASGETYEITVSYGEDAGIPDGTILVASEIEPGTDEYIQHLGQAWDELNREYFEVEEMRENYDESMGELPEIHYTNINTARFFDISLIYNDEEIEPKAPVKVEISYEQGLAAWEETTPGVAHYMSGTQVEIIEDVETTIQDNEVTSFRYEQESFSVVGTYVGQETYDEYVEPKLATAPDPNGSAAVRSASLTDETLDEVVRASLKSSELLRAGETEQPDENDHTDVEKPEAHKTLTPNTDNAGVEDGTYTLTLSVKGHSSITTETQQRKSNVLVVMDRSSSMITKTVSSEETFWYYGTKNTAVFRRDIGDPTYGSGGDYQFWGIVNGEYVRLNANFTGWSTVNFTYWNGTYNESYPADDPLYVRSNKTRMVAEQEALSTLFGELMELNDATGANKDMVEISVISFGDERFDKKLWSDETEVDWQSGRNTSTLMNGVLSNRFTSGTNWEEALQYAYKVIGDKKTAEEKAGKTNEDYYVVFLTDGEPTNSVAHSGGNTAWADNDTKRGQCYDAAKDDAKLIANDYNFYNIFTFRQTEDEKYSIYLSNFAYGEADHLNNKDLAISHNYSDARTIDDLRKAFNNIFFKIEDSIGHGNVSITDTLTTDAMTTTVVQGKTNGYVYEVKDGTGTLLYTVTATGDLSNPTVVFNVPASATKDYTATSSTVGGKTVYSVTTDEGKVYKMALADVNDTTGQLVWDLSPVGLLLDNCTYSVNFVVWPDQDAYDFVAALNNGLDGYQFNNATYNSEKGFWEGDAVKVQVDENGNVVIDEDTGKPVILASYPSVVRYGNEDNGIFAVLTNTDQQLHYSVIETKTENGTTSTEITGPFYHELETPDPMPLTKTESHVEKQWNVERDPGILAQLLYKTDGKPTEYFIDFGILQDDDGTTTDDDAANTYTSVRLGWDATVDNGDGTHGAYAWDTTDPNYVKTVTYSGKQCVVGTRWASNFSIATGLMLSGERMDDLGLDKTAYPSTEYKGTLYYVLEEGHDFTLTEPGLSYDFDFTGPTYHPMLVDGVLRSVDVDYTKDNQGKITDVTITGMTSADVDLSSLKIENTLRGYINLDKVVVGTDGTTPVENDNTKFEYTVILENSTVPGPFTIEGSHVPWYGISGLYYHTIDENGDYHYYQAETNTEDNKAHIFVLTTETGDDYTAWCSDSEGNEVASDVLFDEDIPGPTWITYNDGAQNITLKLYGNQMERTSDNYVSATIQINNKQTLNIANVPVGSTYTITESDEPGYEFVKVVREIKKDPDAAAESSDTVTSKTITGTIVEDRDNHITYTNKTTTSTIEIQKIWDTPEGLPSGTADVVLYKVVGKKTEDLEEGEIDPAKPSEKIRITINANLISETTGEAVGVSDSAWIDVEYTGTASGSYRLSNETGWQHTFEYDRGGTYNFTYTVDGEKVKSIAPEENEGIDTTKTIQLTATVEHVPQFVYTFTVPEAERQSRGGVLVAFNGEEQTASADNNWTVRFSAARDASVTYSASSINGFITDVTLDPAAMEGEEAISDKTVKIHPDYAATTLMIPVAVNWGQTPPTGTTVTVGFIPDKDGVSSESLTLNGDDSWSSSKELSRLDDNGELITWTVTTGVASSDDYYVAVSLTSSEGATISDTASNVVINGTAGINTMIVPVSVDWGTATPDAGTTITVTFTNGTSSETVILNGSETTAWATSKTLPRLDASGHLLSWAVTTDVSPEESSASVSGAPASVSDDDGDGEANAVALTGNVNRTMNLTLKTSGSVTIGGFYKANLVNGTVYYSKSDSVRDLSIYGEHTESFTGLDVTDASGEGQFYVILLWNEGNGNGNVDTTTDLTTAGYTISAKEDYFTTRTVVYFKAETGNRTIELTKNSSTSGNVSTGQTMRTVNAAAKTTSKSGRSLMRSRISSAPLKAAVTGSPTQTFYDPSANTSEEAEGKVAFEVIQFKDLPENAIPVTADGNGKSGTQTVTGNNSCTWSKLPNQDENGNPIYYYVVEKQATAQADTMSVSYSYAYNEDGTISKVIITNTTTGTPTPTKGDITVTKSFEGLDGVDLPEGFKITNDYDEQEFTVSNATGTNPYTWTLSGIDDGTTVIFTESGSTVNGYNLTVTSGGTVASNSQVSATVVAGDTVTASLVNTYELKTTEITLKKTDKSDVNTNAPDLLKGASFTITKYYADNFQSKDTTWGTSGSKALSDTKNSNGEYSLNGVFTFDELTVGYYLLEEPVSPDGYIRMTSNPTLKVEANESNELVITLINNPDNLLRVVDGQMTIIVGNEPGAELPNTGGPGTKLIYLAGVLLTLFGAVMLMGKKIRA